MDLKDSVAFVYGDTMLYDVQNEREVLLGESDPRHMSDEKRVRVQKCGQSRHDKRVEENSAMDVWRDYWIDCSIKDD